MWVPNIRTLIINNVHPFPMANNEDSPRVREYPDSRRVKSVDTAFAMIELIKQEESLGLTEIADEMGLAKSTIHRYLNTLEERGYLTEEDNKYSLGLRFYNLGHIAKRQKSNYRVAENQVEKLAQSTGEKAQFVVEEHGRGIYIHQDRGRNAVQTDPRVGKRVYLHTTAAGKAILAYLPEERVDDIINQYGLKQMTDETITDEKTLKEELEGVREKGYATNEDEHINGLWGIGSPILGPSDRLVGAISVSGPSNRMRENLDEGEHLSSVRGAAEELSLNIQYTES